VTRNGKRAWLFGTLHIGVEAERLPKVVWDKIGTATMFVMEMDVSDPAVPAAMAKEAMLPPDRNLERELGPELWRKTVAATGGVLPAPMLARFEPWFVVVTISAQLLPATRPMDAELQGRAKQEGDALVYLESWQQQVGMLEEAMDLEVLKDTVSRLDQEKKMAKAMLRAYLAGDADALAAIAFDPEEIKRHPKLYQKLFYQRNDAWLPVLQKQIARGDVFVAVGAAHLLGDRGLIAMLEKSGHQSKRLGAP
jgi:hypothetical protein